jgi:hypothetical protein
MAASSKKAVYRAAMRLIEQHGDAAELAAILRGDPVLQADEQARQVVLEAIAELRNIESNSRPS